MDCGIKVKGGVLLKYILWHQVLNKLLYLPIMIFICNFAHGN